MILTTTGALSFSFSHLFHLGETNCLFGITSSPQLPVIQTLNSWMKSVPMCNALHKCFCCFVNYYYCRWQNILSCAVKNTLGAHCILSTLYILGTWICLREQTRKCYFSNIRCLSMNSISIRNKGLVFRNLC